ncbi:MAG: response regulator [Bryobacteraceae bacterium]
MVRTVLIVEDSPNWSSTLEIALERIPNTEVAHAVSGSDALRFLEGPNGAKVRLVVTDLQMPVMDGFELIERVRAVPAWTALPIVVVSGIADSASKDRLARLGANAFFPKPYSPSEVRTKIEELMSETGLGEADG